MNLQVRGVIALRGQVRWVSALLMAGVMVVGQAALPERLIDPDDGALEAGPMEQFLGSSMMCKDARMSRAQDAQERRTYRTAVGPQQGRKVFTLQTLPASDGPFADGVGKVAGFSLHARVAARADQRQKLERSFRYNVQVRTSVAEGRKPRAIISRPAISEKGLPRTPNGNVRYQLKTPYRDGTTHVI